MVEAGAVQFAGYVRPHQLPARPLAPTPTAPGRVSAPTPVATTKKRPGEHLSDRDARRFKAAAGMANAREAKVVTEHRRQILAGLKSFNDAYAVTASKNRAPGGWMQSGVPASCGMVATCDHVADVYHALSCPRFRLEAALTASMHSLSQDVYARTQEAGGLRFYRLRAIMREYRAALLRVADFAPSIFAATMAEAEKYYPIEEGVPAAAAAPAAATAAAAAAAAAPAVSAGAAPALLRARGGNEITVVGMGTRNKRTSSKFASERSKYGWAVLYDTS
jgi:hypothetical protein